MNKIFTVVAAFAVAIASMTSYVTADESKRGGTLRAALGQTPRHLNRQTGGRINRKRSIPI